MNGAVLTTCGTCMLLSRVARAHRPVFRLDKYLMLVRRFVNASFRLLMREKWDASVCTEYNGILMSQGGPPLCVAGTSPDFPQLEGDVFAQGSKYGGLDREILAASVQCFTRSRLKLYIEPNQLANDFD